jgi:methylenetetrahydrofolate dehydrogenase (NADP+)/methenyltetrahydrofolate cyclohydrolase
MSARIIDGKSIAATIREEVKRDVAALRQRGVSPCLAAILVGDNAASKTYVANKRKACDEVGIESVLHTPASDLSEQALLELICELNDDPNVHGILVQLPLPRHIDERLVIEAMSPSKDVDGFHPINLGRLILGLDTFKSCTPAGISELIHRSGYAIESKHVVIIGRSNIVGKPMMNILVQKTQNANATVTVCHSQTRDLALLTCQADILIAALGRPQFVASEMVKPGAIVVDVGINRVEDATHPKGYRLVGDVDFESVKNVAAAITPVPGGVGPMTVAMLMVNTVKASKMALEACRTED